LAVAALVGFLATLVGPRAAGPAAAAVGDALDPMVSVWVEHVANDAANTVKVNALARIGGTVYVGGNFAEIAPERQPAVTPGLEGGGGIPRPYLFAVDATTGNPKWEFTARVNGPVYALEVDPATNTVYVGGDFTTVNGQTVQNLAILDGTTGALKGQQFPVTGGVNPDVRVLHRHALTGKLYVGGDFERVVVNGTNHNRGEVFRLDLATGTLDPYKVQVTGTVLSVAVDPDDPAPPYVYVGGEFTSAGPPPGDPTFHHLVAFAAELAPGAEFGALRTAWNALFSTSNDPRVRSLALKGSRLYAAIGGNQGWFTIYSTADGATREVNWRTDGDVQVVKAVGTQVLVGGHFARITNLPETAEFGTTTYSRRCQMFAIPQDVTQTGPLMAAPNVRNSAHYGAFAVVADDTDGDGAPDDTFWGGHLARMTPGPDTTPPPYNPSAGQGQCGNGVSSTWGGLWHLQATPSPDTTKPTSPGILTVTTGPGTATANVSWTAATDANGVAAYYVFLNNTLDQVVAGNVTTATVDGLDPDDPNLIRVRAVDPATNFREYPTATWSVPPPGDPTIPSPLNGFGEFHPSITPTRILDTRAGLGRPGRHPQPGGATLGLPVVSALSGVPAHAQLVAMNVTVVAPSVGGFLTVWPSGLAKPTVSNLNFSKGQTVANLVVARINGGKVDVQLNTGAAHVLVDVVGWFGSGQTMQPGSRLTTRAPSRVLDSRTGLGMAGGRARTIGAGQTIEVQVVPAGSGISGAVLNLTGVGPTTTTFVTAYPADQAARPTASNLNLIRGQIRPNQVMVRVPASGRIKLFNSAGSVHLLVDVVGTFTARSALDGDPAGRVLALSRPDRLIDTRPVHEALSGPAETVRSFASLAAATTQQPVRGVVANVTATNATATTYLTLYPPDQPRPTNASNLNVRPGENVPNLAVAALSGADTLGVYNFAGSVHYIVDVTAFVLG
jgi:hypothetical protein